MIDYASAGTYASLYLTNRSVRRLKRWALNNIDKESRLLDYHITLCYSTKPIPYQALGLLPPLPVKPKQFSLFGKNEDYLVLEVESAFANNRQEYSKLLGAVSDFPDYKPHISLAKGFKGKVKDLEPFDDILYISREESVPLDPKFSPDKQKVSPSLIKSVIDEYRKLGISANLDVVNRREADALSKV